MNPTRGRPPFKPTAAQRRQVAIAAGGGMSHEALALALGISRNTLEKHFEVELSVGASACRQDILNALHRAAKNGNVSAAKAYLAATPEFSPLPGKTASPAASAPSPSPAVATTGKKEAANVAAKTAQVGTGWDGLLPGPVPLQ